MNGALRGQERPIARAALQTVLLSALALLSAPVAHAAARAAPPPDFLGVSSEDAFAGTDAWREKAFADQAAAGVRLVRQPFYWSGIETASGSFQLAPYDRFVAAAARHGIRVLPVLFDDGPRRRFREMVTFAQVLWWRYGPEGSLWRVHPELPRLPVRSWQIWNEPSLRRYWKPRPNPRQYGRMLRQVGSILSAVDPTAEIVTAGLPASRLPGAVPIAKYVRGLDRSSVPFDTLAFNAYARDVPQLMRNLRAVRRVLDRSGRSRTRIWITELGWSDTGPRSRFRAGRRGQARMIERAFRAIERERRRLRLRGVVYHSWMDGRPYAPRFRDFWGLHTGLLRLDGRPKPAYWTFVRSARRLGWSR